MSTFNQPSPGAATRLEKRSSVFNWLADRWIALATVASLAVVAVIHAASWTDRPAGIDPIHFYCALSHYDLGRNSPHAPGYPAYVGLGRIAATIVEPAHAYQLVNLGMLLGAAAMLGLIGAKLASGTVGAAAALLFATSPLAMAATVTSECYICDAFGSSAVAVWGLYGFRWGKPLGLVGFALIFLFVGLTRAVSCVMLLPLALATVHLSTPGDRRLLLKVVASAGLATIGAYILTVWLAGGPAAYRAHVDNVMGNAFRGSSMLGGASFSSHRYMLLLAWRWFAVLAGPALLIFFASGWVQRSSSPPRSARAVSLLAAAWIVPMLLFYSTIYFLKPTYHVFYLPAIMLLLAFGIDRAAGGRSAVGLAATGLLATLQMTFFVAGPPPGPLDRLDEITRSYFVRQDEAWRELERAVASQNSQTLLIYRDHPTLQPNALRLVAIDATFGRVLAPGNMDCFWDGHWTPRDQVDLSRYNRSILIDRDGDRALYTIVNLPPAEAFEVEVGSRRGAP